MTAPKKTPARHDDEQAMPHSGIVPFRRRMLRNFGRFGRSRALGRRSTSTPLGLGWEVEVTPSPRQATIVVRHPSGRSEIEVDIVLTAEGPRLRARASALELETRGAVTTRCESFRVEAQERIELVSKGAARLEGREVDVASTGGDVRVQANDDVKLKGEMVLLNCDREEPAPTWVEGPPVPTPSLAVEAVSGSPELARLFERLANAESK